MSSSAIEGELDCKHVCKVDSVSDEHLLKFVRKLKLVGFLLNFSYSYQFLA